MENHRPYQKTVTLLLLIALLPVRCTFGPSGRDDLTFVSSFPQDGEKNVRAFGRYYFVFSRPVAYDTSDAVTATFKAGFSASGETLYVERRDPYPVFDSRDTIRVGSLHDPESGQVPFSIQVAFTTARGETEDNGLPALSDTLGTGDLVDGVIGLGSSQATDRDHFTVVPAGSDSFVVDIRLLDEAPVLCVRLSPDSAWQLSPQTPAAMVSGDTLNFFLTNEYGQVRVSPGGWYRIQVKAR